MTEAARTILLTVIVGAAAASVALLVFLGPWPSRPETATPAAAVTGPR